MLAVRKAAFALELALAVLEPITAQRRLVLVRVGRRDYAVGGLARGLGAQVSLAFLVITIVLFVVGGVVVARSHTHRAAGGGEFRAGGDADVAGRALATHYELGG